METVTAVRTVVAILLNGRSANECPWFTNFAICSSLASTSRLERGQKRGSLAMYNQLLMNMQLHVSYGLIVSVYILSQGLIL